MPRTSEFIRSSRGCTLAGFLGVLALSSCSPMSEAPDSTSVPQWSSSLDLRVGSVDDPDYALTFFRDMEVGPDGTMYTVHPQEQLIRVFSPDGSLRRTIGGEGDGPGEFQNILGIGWVADTLWVLDGRGRRFSQFDTSGELLGSFTVPFAVSADPDRPHPPRPNGLLFDGTVHGSPPAVNSMIADGTLTVDVPMLMNRDGVVTDTLPGTPFGRTWWAIGDPDNPQAGGLYMLQPFGDGPLWGFVPGERAIVVLEREAPPDPATAEVRVTRLTFDGDTLATRILAFDAAAVPASVVDSIVTGIGDMMEMRGILGVTAAQGAAWAERSLYRPAWRPAVRNMVLARDGGVWLDTGSNAGGTHQMWLVLAPDGAPVGRVELPGDIDVLIIDPPYVWASETDDFDVPYLVRFRVADE